MTFWRCGFHLRIVTFWYKTAILPPAARRRWGKGLYQLHLLQFKIISGSFVLSPRLLSHCLELGHVVTPCYSGAENVAIECSYSYILATSNKTRVLFKRDYVRVARAGSRETFSVRQFGSLTLMRIFSYIEPIYHHGKEVFPVSAFLIWWPIVFLKAELPASEASIRPLLWLPWGSDICYWKVTTVCFPLSPFLNCNFKCSPERTLGSLLSDVWTLPWTLASRSSPASSGA